MTCQRETLNVKREVYLDASRFTLHERRGLSLAGC